LNFQSKRAGSSLANYLFAGAAAFVLAAGAAPTGAVFAFTAGAFSAGAVSAEFAAGASDVFASVEFPVVAGASAGVSGLAESTETFPLNAGIEMNNADIMNTTAATIVTFERIVVVPRGVNAELDILLVKRAPASVLPGCRRTAPTSTTQDKKKNV
jgi:hypothetical protein